MALKLFNTFLNKKKINNDIYKYSVRKSALIIYVPEEYFFPDFISTTEFLEEQDFYSEVDKVILDFQQCKLLHGIGMSLEVQNYYERAKLLDKEVLWIGNESMHKVIGILLGSDCKSVNVIPYFPTLSGIVE